MRKTLAVAALFVMAACAPKAEEAPAVDTTAAAAPAPAMDSAAAPMDSMAAPADTTKM